MVVINKYLRSRVLLAAIFACSGCASAPHAQLSAADSMDLLASSLETAIEEYRDDLKQLDDQRRKAVVEAFVARVRMDHRDESALAAHTSAFTTALDRIEADRRTASDRRAAAVESLETLKEIADGLRRLAVESMNLDDEARRYLTDVLSQIQKSQTPATGAQNVAGP